MNHTSQNILKEVLLEYTETEAAQVPPTEELMRAHTFSKRFLKKMSRLTAREERNARGTEERNARGTEERNDRGTEERNARGTESEGEARHDAITASNESFGKRGFFRRMAQRHASLRVAAVCIVCVIVFGAGWMIYRGSGGLISSDSSATDMAAVDSDEMATEDAATEEITTDAATEDAAAEEITTDAAEESIAGEDTNDADMQSEADSGSQESEVEQDNNGTAQGGILSAAQAETDLAGLSVAVNSCTVHSMELELANETGAEITYGNYYVIETYDEASGTWAAAEQIYDSVFEDLAYVVQNGETVTLKVDWSDMYGELGAGTWRLTKEVQPMGDEEIYTLTVLFEIG